LIVSSDLPLLTGEFLDEIISKYEESGKPALTVMVPEEAFREYGLSAVSLYEHEGRMYAVSGINIIDGNRILEEQEQQVIVSSRPEAVFTVNSTKDLESAKNYLLNTKSGCTK
jgi:GTP:adenosylcobinamide-phosphate guanylyltransferase